MIAPVIEQRVAVEPDGAAPSWWAPAPKLRLPRLSRGPLSDPEPLLPEPTSRHRLTVRRMADPINTWTVAELRYREGAYAWPRPRVAMWLVVLGYLVAVATILTALLLEGLQAVEERHSAPPETATTLPATTVAVPTPGVTR